MYLGSEHLAAIVSGDLALYLNILEAVKDRPDRIIRPHVAPERIEVEMGRDFDVLHDSEAHLQLIVDLSGPTRA